MRRSVLQLDPRDNVLIALNDLKAGEQVQFSGQTYSLLKNVAGKHKFATQDLGIGGHVIMYGVLVGRAVKPIAAGELLTTGNIQHQATPFREQSESLTGHLPTFRDGKAKTFWDIAALMVKWAHETIGWSFPSFFARTKTFRF